MPSFVHFTCHEIRCNSSGFSDRPWIKEGKLRRHEDLVVVGVAIAELHFRRRRALRADHEIPSRGRVPGTALGQLPRTPLLLLAGAPRGEVAALRRGSLAVV